MLMQVNYKYQYYFHMLLAKRVTIMVDEDLDKRLRIKQAKLIQQTTANVSYSSVINSALRGKVKI